MPIWLSPTARAIGWWPLALVAAGLAAVSGLAAYDGIWPGELVGVAAAALAAAVVAGLHDPAAALLSAVPTSVAVRRGRRLALLVPAELAAWGVWLASGQRWEPGLGWPFGGLVALTAAGLAVSVWAPAHLGLAVGVAVPLAWVSVARAGGLTWDQHTELVTIAALAALWTGRDR